jgi:DNA-binding response OmpR family regulator
MPNRVLIVEDEPDIRDLLAFHLERDGYHVSKCGTGADALRLVQVSRPDLVLLDLMLPVLNGLEVCRRLRQDPATAALPVIMLTAKGEEVDRIVGLELGADDYIAKPFSPKEVVARVRAVMRRARFPESAPTTVGKISIDVARHTVEADGARVMLTPKEFDLLLALVDARGRVLSREFLLDRVWGYAAADEIESRTVDVHVRRLRVKLGKEGRRVLTVKGVGYRLDPELA